MARKPKLKPQAEPAKTLDEPGAFDTDGVDDDVGTIEVDDPPSPQTPANKSRDWRDVEKFKEMLRLRRLVDDDLDFDDKPRR